jgi:hypothetical protein
MRKNVHGADGYSRFEDFCLVSEEYPEERVRFGFGAKAAPNIDLSGAGECGLGPNSSYGFPHSRNFCRNSARHAPTYSTLPIRSHLLTAIHSLLRLTLPRA